MPRMYIISERSRHQTAPVGYTCDAAVHACDTQHDVPCRSLVLRTSRTNQGNHAMQVVAWNEGGRPMPVMQQQPVAYNRYAPPAVVQHPLPPDALYFG